MRAPPTPTPTPTPILTPWLVPPSPFAVSAWSVDLLVGLAEVDELVEFVTEDSLPCSNILKPKSSALPFAGFWSQAIFRAFRSIASSVHIEYRLPWIQLLLIRGSQFAIMVKLPEFAKHDLQVSKLLTKAESFSVQ